MVGHVAARDQSNGYGEDDGDGRGDGFGEGYSFARGNGYGSGADNGGDSTDGLRGNGWGDGDGHNPYGGVEYGDIDYIRNGYGHGDGDGINHSDGTGADVLYEVGIPYHLHDLFLPLTQHSLLNAAAFAKAETPEQKDAIIGLLELSAEPR